jgi:hypothetical protein
MGNLTDGIYDPGLFNSELFVLANECMLGESSSECILLQAILCITEKPFPTIILFRDLNSSMKEIQ